MPLGIKIPGFGRGGGEGAPAPSPAIKIDPSGEPIIDATGQTRREGPTPNPFETPGSLKRKQEAEVALRAKAAAEATPDNPVTPGNESAEAGLAELRGGPDRWGGDANPSAVADMGQMAADHADGEAATGVDPSLLFARTEGQLTGPVEQLPETPHEAPKDYTVGEVASRPFVRKAGEPQATSTEAVSPVPETGAAPLSHDGETGPGGNSFVQMEPQQGESVGEIPLKAPEGYTVGGASRPFVRATDASTAPASAEAEPPSSPEPGIQPPPPEAPPPTASEGVTPPPSEPSPAPITEPGNEAGATPVENGSPLTPAGGGETRPPGGNEPPAPPVEEPGPTDETSDSGNSPRNEDWEEVAKGAGQPLPGDIGTGPSSSGGGDSQPPRPTATGGENNNAPQPQGETLPDFMDRIQQGSGIDRDTLDDWRSLDKNSFDDAITDFGDQIEDARDYVRRARTIEEKQKGREAIKILSRQQKVAQKIFERRFGQRHPTEEATEGATTAHADVAAIRGQAERWAKEASAIRGMGVDELENRGAEVGEQLSILEDRLGGMRAGSPQYAELQAEINHLRRLKDDVLPEAKTKAEASKTKDESKTTSEETKAKQRAVEAARRETASSKDLTAMKDATTKKVGEVDTRLKAIDKELERMKDKPDSDPEKKKLLDERSKLWDEETGLRERLREEEIALEAAQKKEKAKTNAETGISKDTIKQLTPEEFQDLVEQDPEKAGKYLLTLARVYSLDAEKHASHLKVLRDKLLRGGPDISARDEANFVDGVGDLLIKRGRKAVDMKELNVILSKYPEIRAALAQKMEQSELAKQLKEKYPSNWEKMTRYAKGKPGWLMILILMIAGGALGAVKLGGGGGKGGHIL